MAAYAHSQDVVLSHVAVGTKENEIAIARVLLHHFASRLAGHTIDQRSADPTRIGTAIDRTRRASSHHLHTCGV